MNQDKSKETIASKHQDHMAKRAYTLVQLSSAYDDEELTYELFGLFSDAAVVAGIRKGDQTGDNDSGESLAVQCLLEEIKKCDSLDVLDYCYQSLQRLITQHSLFRIAFESAFNELNGKENMLKAIKNFEDKEILRQILKVNS